MRIGAATAFAMVSVLLAPLGATAVDGRVIYAQTCAQCHANGVAGAPRIGDKTTWLQRIALGRDALLTTVLRGKGAMPAKGGNASLSDVEAKAAMEHMLNQVK